MDMMTRMMSTTFSGAEVQGGSVAFATEGGQRTLTLSEDFQVPGAPAPHWRVVDSAGNAFLLQRLMVVGPKYHRTITLPSHVGSVAKVQIWCSFAEVLLGEAEFETAVG